MNSDFMMDYPIGYMVGCLLYWVICQQIYMIYLTCTKERLKISLGLFVVFHVVNVMVSHHFSYVNPQFTGTLNLILCLLSVCLYGGSWQGRCWSGFLAMALGSISEIVTINLSILFLKTDFHSFSTNSFQVVVGHLISKFAPFVFLSIYHNKTKMTPNNSNFLTNPQSVAFYLIPLISLFNTNYLYVAQLTPSRDLEQIVFTVCSSLFLINVIFFWLFNAFTNSMKKHYQHKMLELQVEYYEKLYHNVGEERMAISTLRHNIKNDLISLQSSLKSGDIPEVQQQLDQLLEDESLENQRNSIIPIVDAVLSYKIPQAEKMGVELEHIQALTPDLEVSNPHLANILGNILDNAMEYVSELPEKELRWVELQMKKSGQNLSITVRNPFIGELLLHEDLPLSSKREGKSHGIGLVTVGNLVNELGGYFSVVVENQVFIVKVVIYQCFPDA